MQTLKAEQVIVSLFNQFGDQWLGAARMLSGLPIQTDIGMAFTVQIQIHNHGYERDGKTYHRDWERDYRRSAYVIVLASRRVYTAISMVPDLNQVLASSFINTSNHDSCWKESGLRIINEALSEGYDYCWSHVPAEQRSTPSEMFMLNILGSRISGDKPVQFVRVKRGPKTAANPYFDTLESIRPMKMNIILEEL